jgi:hypothetical protein
MIRAIIFLAKVVPYTKGIKSFCQFILNNIAAAPALQRWEALGVGVVVAVVRAGRCQPVRARARVKWEAPVVVGNERL